ncbi:Gfo/Idh/MocA family oxidoreductase [Salinispirillum sp. LH 10-3-1]|uniref:Gfo/Idh/MocA family oxidoreductase n=1 Tax=Salinispirillum sp. LH 10-3-1 TaxID=2952525 RepID=A0AB38YGX6_9GAMM
MSASPIRVGLIGFGLSGRIFHAPFIQALADFELSAVQSRQVDLVHSIVPSARVVGTSQALMDDPNIDLMVITAPNDLHFPLAEQALQAGKHVLLEKPAVTQLLQMERLTELAAQYDRILTVYQNRRFDGDFLTLQALIADGAMGALRHLDTRFDRFRPQPQHRWRELPGEGTGIFWDLGPHLLDQALLLLGAPDSLQANLRTLRQGGSTTDWFEVQLNYAQCAVTVGSSPFEAGDMRRFNARFEHGGWQCWGVDPQEEALRGGQMPWDTGYPNSGSTQRIQRFLADESFNTTPPPGDYRHFYRQLALAIREGGAAPVTPAQACALIYTMNLAEQSAAEQRTLPWSYAL